MSSAAKGARISADDKLLVDAGRLTREEARERAAERAAAKAAQKGGEATRATQPELAAGVAEEQQVGGEAADAKDDEAKDDEAKDDEATDDEAPAAQPAKPRANRHIKYTSDGEPQEEEDMEAGERSAPEGAAALSAPKTKKRKLNEKERGELQQDELSSGTSDGAAAAAKERRKKKPRASARPSKGQARGSGKGKRASTQPPTVASLPGDDELAAFAAAQEAGDAGDVDAGPSIVGSSALKCLPALDGIFRGKPHSTYTVHAQNPDERCRPVHYRKVVAKRGGTKTEEVESFPVPTGGVRAVSESYMQSNMMLAFLLGGKGTDSMWEAVCRRVAGLHGTTKPSQHLALMGGTLNLLGAGDLFERWVYYRKAQDWRDAFWTLPKEGPDHKIAPPGFKAGATPEDNSLNVRKALWAWAFGDRPYPTAEEMMAKGGPVQDAEMYSLAVKMFGLPPAVA